jgi:hypothetical protein
MRRISGADVFFMPVPVAYPFDYYRSLTMVSVTIEMPEGALAVLRKDPPGFARELRLAAAVKWYELRLVSQGRAAEVAGLSRAEFIAALGRFGVSPFQYGADEILEEADGG